jgi:ElaB/YqjD/DUF883 family membrane-anchored ribosome-binding protein
MATSTPPDVGGQGLVGLGEAQEAVQEKAGEAKDAVVRAVSERLDTASSQAGGQLIDISGALRQTGEQLRTEGKEQPAKVVEAVSDRTDQLARYLSDTGSREILDDLERLGRARPWVAIAGGLAVGLASARLLKASSRRRFQDYRTRYPNGYPRRDQELRRYPHVAPPTDSMEQRPDRTGGLTESLSRGA